MADHRYLVALGSNIRHHRHGRPQQVLRAALSAMVREGLEIECASRIIASTPVGPSQRTFANAAAIIACSVEPDALLAILQAVETGFGRCRGGQRWRARVLDLDIVLWNGGAFAGCGIVVPHRLFRERDFVLRPASQIAPDWRDPMTGLTLRHLHARLTRPRAAPR